MRTDSPCAAARLTLATDSFNVEKILDHKVDSNVRPPTHAQPIVAQLTLRTGRNHLPCKVGGLREEGRPDLGTGGEPYVNAPQTLINTHVD